MIGFPSDFRRTGNRTDQKAPCRFLVLPNRPGWPGNAEVPAAERNRQENPVPRPNRVTTHGRYAAETLLELNASEP